MRTLSTLVLILGLAACRGGDDGGGGGNPDAPGNSDDTTIQQIQNDSMPACDPANPATCVELKIKGVIVTAIDAYGSKTGDFWVEEPGGGPFSGVHVYGAPLDQVSALAIGDVVDIAGAEKSEFALSSDTSGNKLTELEPVQGGTMSVTKVMSGTPITPDVVDSLKIGQMTDYMARAAEWEKWEGVLITVNNVSALSKDACVGTNCTDTTLHKFDITGDVSVESSLAAMPTPAVVAGDCLGSVTGVVDYFFDYQILPRTTAEIATGGSSCPPPETSSALCTDGIDNDGNGFSDCNDNNCITAEATCRTQTTISAIQTATTPPSGGVELTDVYVAAISKNKKNMWVQTNLTAAANEGIYIYGTGANITATVGSKVNIIGTVTEFNDSMGTETLTQIKALSITAGTTGTGTVVPVTGQSVTDLSTESYESVLVTLTNVHVDTLGVPCLNGATPPACNYGVGTITAYAAPASGVSAETDDDIAVLGAAGSCYATVTGVWTYLVYDNKWGFLPLT
ncbi:MAG TPA: hypothetical protein VL326_08650, partial [Kofleriaceae bacterium]|nr:hypothetical protein [Kofleriaceae bacterium]